MKVLQIRIFFVVNCLLFQVYVILGEPDWIVDVKVSGFGEHLTLFCLIDDCCTKEAGWVKFDPDYKTIFLDVRNSTNYTSTDKYAATTNNTGFSLTIKNIQKEDINIAYSCVYGFVQSRIKLLNQSDAFRDDETKSELPVTEIIIASLTGGSIIILVTVVVLILKFRQNRRRRKRSNADADIKKITDPSEKNHGECAKLLSEKEERNDLLNVPTDADADITKTVAESSKKDHAECVEDSKENGFTIPTDEEIIQPFVKSSEQDNKIRENILEENDEKKELVCETVTLTDGEITQPVAKSSEQDNDIVLRENIVKENDETKELVYQTTSLTDGEITQPVAKSSEQDNDIRENILKENDETKKRVHETTSLTDGEFTQPVAKSSEQDNDIRENILKENDETKKLVHETTSLTDGENAQPVAKSSEQYNDVRENILKENDERKELVYRTTTLTVLDCEIDIVIIHTEDEHHMEGVESFKNHLKHLSNYMGSSNIIIKLFEDVFSPERMSSCVEIQAVFDKCRYVFVYISRNFSASKLNRFGMKECWIRDALEILGTNSRIRVVSNCASSELPNDQHLSVEPETVFLDYFNYDQKCQDESIDNRNYKKKFSEFLRNM